MNATTRNSRRPARKILVCALAGCLLLGAAPTFAQSTAATLRGSAAADATITATNVNTGLSRSVKAGSNGSYNIGGLPPGTYRIDVQAGGQSSSQGVTLAVGQTATLDLQAPVETAAPAGDATTLDAVTVTAPMLVETKTSEVATYVSQKQIEALPQGTRNFLAFADVVPGMQFIQDAGGNTKLRSGAQSSSGINVYVDGVGQKGYTLPGGVGGQDSTRGNPFPQSAIGEYKVITSNYKAEFDQISSAAVVAATRAGSNDFEGSLFWDRTSSEWRTKSEFEKRSGSDKIPDKEEQYGVSFGGPIVKDLLHFFVAYEAKEYNTPKSVTLGAGPGSRYDVADVPADLLAGVGPTWSPFKQDMYFGKLSWTPDDRNYVEFSTQYRKEDEIIGVGDQNTPQRATLNQNKVTRHDLRWQYSGDVWLNDAHLTYEDLSWAPHPAFDGNGYILQVSELQAADRTNIGTILNGGAGTNNQNKGQDGWAIQDDLTFTGWDGHTVKMGLKYKKVNVNAIERHYSNPQFYYDIGLSTEQPYRVEFATGDAGTSGGFTTSANKQFGIYIQDDWEVNDHLTLNYGVRWDYEETPNYEDFVTPTALAENIRAYPNFQNADWNPDDYISTGNNRKPFKNAWQPRLGFSYDISADQRHVIFGGVGRAYDRNLFDYLQIETNRTSFGRYNFYFTDADGVCRRPAGDCVAWNPAYLQDGTLDALAATQNLPREWWLNNNDLKVPYSDQFSLGMRNAFDWLGQTWNSEVTLVYVHSKDGITARLGNRRPDGSFLTPGHTWGTPWGFDPPFGRIVLLDNMYETKNKSVLLKLEKPYTSRSGWGATLAYTYTHGRQNTNMDGWIDMFEYPDASYYGWLPSRGVPEHRLVATGIWDAPGGVTLSGKLTLESSKYRNATDCRPGWDDCLINPYKPGGNLGYKRFDLAATKQWDTGTDVKLRIRADLLNVFDWVNYGGYDDWYGGPGENNANFGVPNSQLTPTRTFKLSFGLDW
ncbi:MAG: TonB-dependent receptor [Pseudoxanthomonas sp.]